MVVGGTAFLAALGIAQLLIGPLIPDDQQILGGLAGLALSGLVGLAGFAAAVGLRIRGLSAFGVGRTSKGWLLAGASVGVASALLSLAVYMLYLAITGDQRNVQSGYQSVAAGGGIAL